MLKISLVAVLAVAPLLSYGAAANVDKQPVEADPVSSANVATTEPQYALQPASATDSNVATAGYVKGAYNASIRAINKVAADVSSLAEDVAGIDLSGVATQDGVVATVNQASASYTPGGTVGDVTIDAMNEWGSDTPGSITVPGGTFSGTPATIKPTVSQYYATAPSND